MEHLENYRALLREAWRVLAPGGTLVVSTPNVLNASPRLSLPRERVRQPVRSAARRQRQSTAGHITPIPYFYLVHALREAGFEVTDVAIEKVQKTSVACLALLAPLIAPGRLLLMRAERKRYRTITAWNRPHAERHRSWPLLVGRMLVVAARKAA